MCGRYTLTTPITAIAERFNATPECSYSPRYNIAPEDELAIIDAERSTRITTATWGLIPPGNDRNEALINARIETVTERPAFREAYDKRRCLVIVDGFYEWVETDDGKQPYRVHRTDDEPFAVAGIWEPWQPSTTQTALTAFEDDEQPSESTEEQRRVAILTTEPNDLIGDLHHRMAVILPPDRRRDWLAGTLDQSVLESPYPDDGLEAYPVTTAVNDPTNEDPTVIEPLGPRRR
ncbi:MAG: SOS response-associated peptidase [Halobacteriales archaeon]|nr:SOS response-associated peptidase [Halobacteriales archaeon]